MSNKIDCEKFYEKFYEDFFRDMEIGSERTERGKIAANVSEIINEAHKLGYIKNGMEKEFLKGMFSYFEKKGINVEISDLSIIGYLSYENDLKK